MWGDEAMDLDKTYHDSEGKECNIRQIVEREPEWAANLIQEYEKRLLAIRADVKKALSEAVAAIYFIDDNSDYQSALWSIVDALEGVLVIMDKT